MTSPRSSLPIPLPFTLSFTILLSACATAGGTLVPLGPDHPASPDAPEVAIADPSALLRAQGTFSTAPPAYEAASAGHAAGAYVCPMHAEVASDQPGRCPQCNMKLVRREEAQAEQQAEHDHDG